MATIFHASRHFVLFSIRFDRAVIDLLISFNYKVNDFLAPPGAARRRRSLLSAIKEELNEADDRVTNQRRRRRRSAQLRVRERRSFSGSPLPRPESSASSLMERTVAAAMAEPADE